MNILVVADDLTGACDTGHEFATRGYRTVVAVDGGFDPDAADVLVVNTDTRYAEQSDAADAVAASIDTYAPPTVYKKMDSTLRGNVVAETDAVLAATREGGPSGEPGLAIVAPASPANGRITADGCHLVHGKLVTESDPGQDREKAPPTSHLSTLFEGSVYPVATLGIETVARGSTAVTDRLRELPHRSHVVVADATHPAHLEAIATGANAMDIPIVYVGSAGLAGYVDAGEATGCTATYGVTEADGVLGIVGSHSARTLDALERLPSSSVVVLDGRAVISEPERAVTTAVGQAVESIAAEGMVVLTSARTRADVDRTVAAGRTEGLSPRETSEHIAQALSQTTRAIVETEQIGGLFLTGGDTALGVLKALNAQAIELTGEAVEAGIPIGIIVGGEANKVTLVTKAGAFGDRNTVLTCLDRLRAP